MVRCLNAIMDVSAIISAMVEGPTATATAPVEVAPDLCATCGHHALDHADWDDEEDIGCQIEDGPERRCECMEFALPPQGVWQPA